MKILVPVDGSDNAMRAVELACRLIQGADQVVLLNVVGRGEVPEALKRYAHVRHAEAPPEWAYEGQVSAAVIESAAETLRRSGVANFDTMVRRGDAAKTISEVAAETGADLIVMGSRGLGALEGLAFGSVSRRVCHDAPCQVVTVS